MMRLIRRVVTSTEDFARKHEAVLKRIDHFTDVVALSGPGYRAFEHRCVFCSLAVGDPENIVTSMPAEGLLRQLSKEVDGSASQAMFNARRLTELYLLGSNLTVLAQRVKHALGAVDVLDRALKALLVDMWPKQLPSMNAAEWLRFAIFLWLGIAAMSGSVIGVIAFFVTRVRMQRN